MNLPAMTLQPFLPLAICNSARKPIKMQLRPFVLPWPAPMDNEMH